MLFMLTDMARRREMSILKRLAVVAVLATAMMAPGGAQAGNGRIAAGVDSGFAADAVVGAPINVGFWGPSPPYYPYYHFGHYGVPVWGPGPFWGPYEYDCHDQVVWTGRHRRHVRVCD
jgi:hypothetical protein